VTLRPSAPAGDPRRDAPAAGRTEETSAADPAGDATIVAIGSNGTGSEWQALANFTDGHESHELVLTLTETSGRRLVSSVGNPR
jgi:hypothetical protein